MKKSTGYFTPQAKRATPESSKRPSSTSEDLYFNESAFEQIINDPNKKKLLLELINANKDEIEEYKRKEAAKKRKKPKCESPIQLYRRKALEQMEKDKENENRVNSPVGSVASSALSSVPSPIPENELLKGVVAFVEVKTKDKDRTPAVQAIMRSMGATVRERFTKDVTHVIIKNGTFGTYQKARIVNAHLVSVLWLDATRKSKCRVPEKNYPAFGLQDYDNNVSVICSQIQKEFEEVLKDERRETLLLTTPNKSVSSEESELATALQPNTSHNSVVDSSDMDLTNISSSPAFNVSSFSEKNKSDSLFKVPSSNSEKNISGCKNKDNNSGNLSKKSLTSSGDMSSLKLSDDKMKSQLNSSNNKDKDKNKDNDNSKSFISDDMSSLKLSESSKKDNLSKRSIISSDMSSLKLSDERNKSIQSNSSKNKDMAQSLISEDASSSKICENSDIAKISNKMSSDQKPSGSESLFQSSSMFSKSKNSFTSSEMSSLKLSDDRNKSIESNSTKKKEKAQSLISEDKSSSKICENSDIRSSDQRPSGSESLFQSSLTATNSIKSKTSFASSEMSSLKLSDDKIENNQIKSLKNKDNVEPCNVKENISKTSSDKRPSGSESLFKSISTASTSSKSKSSDFSLKLSDETTSKFSEDKITGSAKRKLNKRKISPSISSEMSSLKLSDENVDKPLETSKTSDLSKMFTPNASKLSAVSGKSFSSINSETMNNILDVIDNSVVPDFVTKRKKVDKIDPSVEEQKIETGDPKKDGKNEREKETEKEEEKILEKPVRRQSTRISRKKNCCKDSPVKESFQNPGKIKTRGRRKTLAAIGEDLDTNERRKRCRSVGGNSSNESDGSKKIKRKLFNLDDSLKVNQINDDEERIKNRVVRRQKSAETLPVPPTLLVQNKTRKNVENSIDKSNSDSSSEIDEPKRKKLTKSRKKKRSTEESLFDSDEDDQTSKLEQLNKSLQTESKKTEEKNPNTQQTPKTFKKPRQVQSEGRRLKGRSKLPIANLPISPINRRSTLEFQPAATSSQSQRKTANVQRKVPTIVCTKMHRNEIKEFQEIVEELGGFEVEDNVSYRTSHLVAGEPKRTINMLRAMARGCWILNKEWLYKSKKEKKWLPEEDYEMLDFSPTVQKTRRQRQAFGASYAMDIFKNCGPIYVSKNTNVPHQHLRELIHMCKGILVNLPRAAALIVGEHKSRLHKGVVCVEEKWVLDSITANKIQSFKKYLLQGSSSPCF